MDIMTDATFTLYYAAPTTKAGAGVLVGLSRLAVLARAVQCVVLAAFIWVSYVRGTAVLRG